MDDTARQLFGGAYTSDPAPTPQYGRSAASQPLHQHPHHQPLPPPPQPPHEEAAAQAAVSNVSTQELSAAEEEAEAALQYLEAEWADRMEAPLSALAALEDNLSHAIETAMLRLPGYQ